ncbi:hypothetical protein F3L20_33480 (plasmid) [Streptomyces tendae]|uniref:Uncharacterized protein n=1 Tax=Streptomyces tendae TaxID=1932 RepID=A0ABX6A1Q3_STRTE|nr:hypothetical protein F3L20_33480 [Streptomyces tendae]
MVPDRDGCLVGGIPCSPHPRGWSRDRAELVAVRELLPAPAGMAPPAVVGLARQRRDSHTCRNGPVNVNEWERCGGTSASTSAVQRVAPAALDWTGTIRGGARPDPSHAARTGHQPPRPTPGPRA